MLQNGRCRPSYHESTCIWNIYTICYNTIRFETVTSFLSKNLKGQLWDIDYKTFFENDHSDEWLTKYSHDKYSKTLKMHDQKYKNLSKCWI